MTYATAIISKDGRAILKPISSDQKIITHLGDYGNLTKPEILNQLKTLAFVFELELLGYRFEWVK
jgi:hypothetical protein